MNDIEKKVSIEDGVLRSRYVAYCDVLGFSNAVSKDFAAASKVYVDFVNGVRLTSALNSAKVTVYSDSILVTDDALAPVLVTLQSLWWAALRNDWLIRGGVAYGRVWQLQTDGDLFVVSEPLVKAAQIEKAVRVPAIQVSPDIDIPEELWISQFAYGLFGTPLLHFSGMNIANPFNRFWFQSARMRVVQLLNEHPEHSDKYYWFLALAEQVGRGEPMVPAATFASLIEREVVQVIPSGSAQSENGVESEHPTDTQHLRKVTPRGPSS